MIQTTTRVELQEIVVARGDTLYSISRKYSIPVNDLAVMNDLTPPFELSVGQKLRVPNLAKVSVARNAKTATGNVVKVEAKTVVAEKQITATTVETQPVKKISSDPTKKLPTISARSSSKFAWPVRGKILSAYGAKSNGLFNDGINISATRGTAVKAAENGVVAYAGNEVKGMGNLVIVQHDGGWMTVYAHMDSMSVRRGHKVSVGQKIGTVGESGKVDSPQLHFEIRKGTKAYNPSSYLKK
jgi:murein DD-endopeptidase MepM/ murein hydrolase activator NlpD